MALFVTHLYLLFSNNFAKGKTITIRPTESSVGQSYKLKGFDRRFFGHFCAEKMCITG
jgi:hypothetical protein